MKTPGNTVSTLTKWSKPEFRHIGSHQQCHHSGGTGKKTRSPKSAFVTTEPVSKQTINKMQKDYLAAILVNMEKELAKSHQLFR